MTNKEAAHKISNHIQQMDLDDIILLATSCLVDLNKYANLEKFDYEDQTAFLERMQFNAHQWNENVVQGDIPASVFPAFVRCKEEGISISFEYVHG